MTFPYQSDNETPLATLIVGAATAVKQPDGSWRVFVLGQFAGTVQPLLGAWIAKANSGELASFDNLKAAVASLQ